MSSATDAPTLVTAGTKWTAGKSIAAGIVGTIAVSLAPTIVDAISSIGADPEWVRNCVNAKSISWAASLGVGGIGGVAIGAAAWFKRNFVKSGG